MKAKKITPKINKIQQHKKALIEALTQSLGIVTTACKTVGLDRTTFYKYYENDPEFRKSVDDIGNIAIDFVESQNYKLIKEGNPTSIIFYLKTKGRERGYSETIKTEISGSLDITQITGIKIDD